MIWVCLLPELGVWQYDYVKFWNTTDWSQLHKIDTGVRTLEFSPDGKHLALAYGPYVQLYRMGKPELVVTTLHNHIDDRVYTVTWAPDGKHLASGSYQGTAKVWDVQEYL